MILLFYGTLSTSVFSAGKIHISEATKTFLEISPEYIVAERGVIEIKVYNTKILFSLSIDCTLTNKLTFREKALVELIGFWIKFLIRLVYHKR